MAKDLPADPPRQKNYDVVIVGGAMYGSSVSWFLTDNPDFDGSILVVERDKSLDCVTSSGDSMQIEVNKPIIESVFFKNSPLHDGAAIIKGNDIVATRVILPVSRERSIPQRFGLRHRAAIGITERTDALALVVSEETGLISYIKNGEFVKYTDLEELGSMIRKDLST